MDTETTGISERLDHLDAGIHDVLREIREIRAELASLREFVDDHRSLLDAFIGKAVTRCLNRGSNGTKRHG